MTAFLLPIESTLSESWTKVSGSKSSFWAAYGMLFLFNIIFAVLLIILGIISPGINSDKNPSTLGLILNLFFSAIQYLLYTGIMYIGILRALDMPITYRLMFKALELQTALRLIGFFVLQMLLWVAVTLSMLIATFFISFLSKLGNVPYGLIPILIALTVALLLFFSIYILVRISLTPAFILDKKLSLWQSSRLSFSATRSNFWRLIFIGFITILIFIASIIPLGIGLIWSIPFSFILFGMVYRSLLVNTQYLF